MKKEEAVAALGHYFAVRALDPDYSQYGEGSIERRAAMLGLRDYAVIERLGSGGSEFDFSDESSAIEAARRARLKSTSKLDDVLAGHRFGYTAESTARWLGNRILRRKTLPVIADLTKLFNEVSEEIYEPEVSLLPEELDVPVLLEKGQKIYRCRFASAEDFTKDDPWPIDELTVRSVRAYDGDEGVVDVHYDLEGDGDVLQQASHDPSNLVVAGRLHGARYFLREEDALSYRAERAQEAMEGLRKLVGGSEPMPVPSS